MLIENIKGYHVYTQGHGNKQPHKTKEQTHAQSQHAHTRNTSLAYSYEHCIVSESQTKQ